jgi:hypothetical protein
MHHTRTAVIVLAGLVLTLAGATAATAQGTQSLGELAAKEQERRKAMKAAGKVLSNADLPKITSPATPKTLPEGTAAAKPEAEQKPKAAEEERDEAWWRQRMSALREELRRNEMFAEALQTRINSLTNDFSSRDDPYQRARIAEDRQKAMAEMDRVKGDMDLQKKKIAEAEEEARRAGVPPGWVR